MVRTVIFGMNELLSVIIKGDKIRMNKKLCAVICMFFLWSSLISEEFSGVETDQNGRLSIDEVVFSFLHYGDGWIPHGKIRNTPGYPLYQETKMTGCGKFLAGDDAFSFQSQILSAGERSILYSAEFKHDTGISGEALFLRAFLPLNGKDCLKINGKTVLFDENLDVKKKQSGYWGVQELTARLNTVTLTIRGKFNCQVIDLRKQGKNQYELRILLAGKGVVKKAGFSLQFSYVPQKSFPIDFSDSCNAGTEEDLQGSGRPEGVLKNFPIGRQTFGRIPFSIASVTAKNCIALKGGVRAELPEKVEIPLKNVVKAQYLYLFHAIAGESLNGTRIGIIIVESEQSVYVEQEAVHADILAGIHVANYENPRQIRDGMLVWKRKNDHVPIGFYLVRIDLSGRPVKKIILESSGNSPWIIAGMTLSDIRTENFITKPVIFHAGKDYVPLQDVKEILPGSVLDFSGMLDAPAGKYGFLRSAGNHFEFEKRPGVPVRFYGANICFNAHFMENYWLDRMVNDFAAIGYNMIRFHHFDHELADYKSGSSLKMKAEHLKQMDYLLAACRKKGIYVTLDFYTIRKPLKGEIPGLPADYDPASAYKMLVILHEGARRNFKEYIKRLMNHVNSYTGTAWKEEPAIAHINLVNENTIFAACRNPQTREILDRKFKTWKEKKNGMQHLEENQKWHIFLSDLYTEYYQDMKRFCLENGIKVPLSDQNFWCNISTTLLREQYDYVDNHFYWAHPVFLGKNWSPPLMFMNQSATASHAGGVTNLCPSRIFGKPYTVTEWNYVSPNPYSLEGAFLTGAYAAAQNWAGLCRFAYSHGAGGIRRENVRVGGFDIVNDPVLKLSEKAGILFFLRGDVSASKVRYPILIDREHHKRSTQDQYSGILYRLALLGGTGTVFVENGTANLPEGSRIAVAMEDKKPALSIPVCSPQEIRKRLNLDRELFINDTGELNLNIKKGSFLVKNRYSEGFLLPDQQSGEGDFAWVKNGSGFNGFLIAAVDGKTLEQSGRYLILHLTDCRNTGMRFRDPGMSILESYGGLPILIRKAEGRIVLKRDLGKFRLYAVGFNGERLFELPMRVSGNRSEFTVETWKRNTIVSAYEIINEN